MNSLDALVQGNRTRVRRHQAHDTCKSSNVFHRLLWIILLTLLLPVTPAQGQTSVSRIHTLAGGGTNSSTAVSALIARPTGVAVDGAGNFYVASSDMRQVFKVDPSGNLTVLAGDCIAGDPSDGAPAGSTSLNFPWGVASDSAGNLYIADETRIELVDASTGTITAVAGDGVSTGSIDGPGGDPSDDLGDGGPATSASFNYVRGVAVDGSGNIFIADEQNSRIRRVDASTGIITTVAGNGTRGFSGDGGPATSASMNFPYGVAVDSAGDLFIADTNNGRIRRVDGATGIITTVAGGGTPTSGNGDGGPATSAKVNHPYAVALDSSGNLFIPESGDVRRVDAATGIITTAAGNGTFGFSGDGGPATSGTLNQGVADVAVDASGNLFIADQYNNRIRRVAASTGIISTVAGGGTGGDGGPATSALLAEPIGVAVDGSGNVFASTFADGRVRRVSATTGKINTEAGTSVSGSGGDGGPATSAGLSFPYGVAVDASGNLFIADMSNYRVRRVDAVTGVITTVAGSDNYCLQTDPCGDGGPATSAFLVPYGVALDASGNLYIADEGDERIRRVDAATGIITTVAGDGVYTGSIDGPGGDPSDDLGDGGLATNATFECPEGIVLDGSGNLFIADWCANRVRRVDAATGIITTLAGTGTQGFSGDGGPAASAALNGPEGLVFDSSQDLLIADSTNNRLRGVNLSTGIITTVAGNGTAGLSGDGGPASSAELNHPFFVATDSAGSIYITDLANNRIRILTPPSGVALSASSLSFTDQIVGTTSDAKDVTLTNSGAASLTITSITIAGDDSSDFAQTNTCGSSLASGANCTVSVTFTPTATGARNATLTFTDDALDSPQAVALTGTGTAPTASLSAASLSFGNQLVGTTSAVQSVNVMDTSPLLLELTFSNFTIVGPNSGDFAIVPYKPNLGNCGTPLVLPAGVPCAVEVTFTPTAAGLRTASLMIYDNAAGSPQTVALSGTGTDFSVAPASSSTTSESVTVGGTATFSLTIAPSGLSGEVSFTCAVAPSGPTCSVSPASVTLDGTTPADITVSVATTAPSLAPPVSGGPRWPALPITWPAAVWLALGGLLAIAAVGVYPDGGRDRRFGRTAVGHRRYRAVWRLAPLGVLLMFVALAASCGGGGTSTSTSTTHTLTGGTPAGTYNITVTGTSGSLSHSTTLTLTVN